MQPTVSIKNAIQDRRPLPINPRELYRGLLVNAGAMAPTTAIQFGANQAYGKIAQRKICVSPDASALIGRDDRSPPCCRDGV